MYYKKKYFIKQKIFRLQKEDRGSSSSPASPAASPPALNLSYRSEDDKHDDISDKSESELADIEDDGEEMDDNISEDNSIEAASGNGFPAKKQNLENGAKENGMAAPANTNMLHFWQNIQGHIQDLVKTAITNAKDEDESKSEDSASHKDGKKYSKYLISGMTHLPSLLSYRELSSRSAIITSHITCYTVSSPDSRAGSSQHNDSIGAKKH